MNDTKNQASDAHSEALLRAHMAEERRALRMRLIAMFWQENPEASHPEFEAFVRMIDEETQQKPMGFA